MAVEKSVFLNDEQIDSFIAEYYGMSNNAISKIAEGSANCYKIANSRGVFFLKELQKKFEAEAVQNEIKICRIVQDFGIPASEFIEAKNANQYAVSYKGHWFHLQKYIDGHMYKRNTVPDSLLPETAAMLGRINLALENTVSLPEGFPDSWITNWTSDMSLKKYADIIERTSASKMDGEQKNDIIAACQKKIQLLNLIQLHDQFPLTNNHNDNHLKYVNLKRVNSHGDYNNQQILYDRDNVNKIKAVIDFSSAERLPAVWEIIRSYTYSSSECASGDEIDCCRLKAYIDSYLKYVPLSLFDVSNMAGFYYYSLLRSTFGLNSQDKSVIEFGLWRTRLCEYLSESYNDIDLYLMREYKGIL